LKVITVRIFWIKNNGKIQFDDLNPQKRNIRTRSFLYLLFLHILVVPFDRHKEWNNCNML